MNSILHYHEHLALFRTYIWMHVRACIVHPTVTYWLCYLRKQGNALKEVLPLSGAYPATITEVLPQLFIQARPHCSSTTDFYFCSRI